jgi:hypothetical protein
MIKRLPDTFNFKPNFKPVGVARRCPIYQKVFDPRKRRIRGLRKRNGWFYVQMAVIDNLTGKKSRPARPAAVRPQGVPAKASPEFAQDRRNDDLPFCAGANSSPITGRNISPLMKR